MEYPSTASKEIQKDEFHNDNQITKNINVETDLINEIDATNNEIPHTLVKDNKSLTKEKTKDNRLNAEIKSIDDDNIEDNDLIAHNKAFDEEYEEDHSLIIVTGFGPFIGHELVNASWEAVRILPDNFKYNGHNYKIEKKLVSVEYDKVDKAVDEIWNRNPALVVHCGVHGGAKSIYLESLAYNNKFNRPDFARKRLECPTVCLERNGTCCERICTKLNVKEIAKNVNQLAERNDSLTVSNDVGNYLCGYIYLKSLDIDCNRTLFIHVPPINKPFTSNETSKIVFNVIQECVKQIEIMNEAEETCAA